jgi:hypothetical protein
MIPLRLSTCLFLALTSCAMPTAAVGVICSAISTLISASAVASDADENVQFDVPAVLAAKEVQIGDGDDFKGANHRIIAVTVSVTSEISPAEQGNIDAFRFDVFWNRNPYPISDYAPRTQTFSEIAGTIEVDQSSEKNLNYDIQIVGSYPSLANGTAHVDRNHRDTKNIRYNEVPQHEILVASGTVRRGTGAFFRFHPSRSETLEGGRDLLLTFKVPNSWRGGVLQVECTAIGNRKFLGMKEPFETQRAFIVPVYLESDEEAEASAMEFARQEQKLRQSWRRFKLTEQSGRSSTNGLNQFFRISTRQPVQPTVPDDWVHALIQISDQPLTRYRNHLPHELAEAADQFVQSRSSHLKLSR